MKLLQPRHHAAGVVTNETRVDSVGVQHRLCDLRMNLVGKRPDNRVELPGSSAIFHPVVLKGASKSASVTRQLHHPPTGGHSDMARRLPPIAGEDSAPVNAI